MKPIIMYYSYTGNCKKEASMISRELKKADETLEPDLIEIKEARKRTKLGTFFIGCPKAMSRKKSRILDPNVNLNDYDRIILVAPIWSGFPAPAFNAIVDLLPEGKEVELYICSAGGEAPKSKAGTCDLIKKKGCSLIGYHDIKTAGIH